MQIFSSQEELKSFFLSEAVPTLKQHIYLVGEILKECQRNLDIKTIKEFVDKFPELKDKFYFGGHQCKFGLRFEIPDIGSVIIKVFKINLENIMLHFISARSFNNSFKDNIFTIGKNQVRINIADVIFTGYILIDSRKTPFLIQKFSEGIPITEEVINTLAMTQTDFIELFRNILQHGIVLDPYLKNWRLKESSELEAIILEYIDLICWNTPDIKKKSNKLLNSLSLT